LVRRRTIDANVVDNGERALAVGASAVAKSGNDDDAALLRGPAIGGPAQSHAARPHGRNVEPCEKPTPFALLRSCS
jgi:hypothetical protein